MVLLWTGLANAQTGTTLIVNPASGAQGTVFTLSATVVNQAQTPITAGSVTFFNGSTNLGSAVIVNSGATAATATLLTRSLPVGTDYITARFNGTAGNPSSTSSAVSAMVTGLYGTSTNLSSSGVMGSYALNAVVDSFGFPNPTGSIIFTDNTNGTTVGTSPLTGATIAPTFLNSVTTPIAAGPSWMASGDFNRDGYPDLAVVSSPGAAIAIYLGNGNGAFQQPQQTYATGTGPVGLAVGDFNADGKLDLVSVNGSAGTVSILLGNGDGTFQQQAPYPIGGFDPLPVMIAVADVNGDGILDLVVPGSTNSASSANNTVSVLLGNGNGTFQAQLPVTVGNLPIGAVVGDFNGDGIPDLAVANNQDETIGILLGIGNGTFQTQTTYALPGAPEGIAAGDVNGDGILDLVATNASGDIEVLLGNGGGLFASPVTYAAGPSADDLVLADMNGDGSLDAVVSNNGSNTVSVLLGNGNGTFQSPLTFVSGNAPVPIVVADLNGDGRLDLAAVNNTDNTFSVLLGSDSESVTLSNAAVFGSGSHSVTAAYSGDGNFQPSTSAAIQFAATLASTTVMLTPSPGASVVYGQAITVTAAILTQQGAPTPTGSVSYAIDNGTPQSAPLTNGSTALSPTGLAAGLHSLAVSYSGDQNNATSSGALSFTVTPLQTTAPTFSLAAGSYSTAQTVTLADATTGATIYYTVNGTLPTAASTLYTGAITVSSSETIEAIALGPNANYSNSAISAAAYTILPTAATPVFTPASGTYPAPLTVTIAEATSGAKVYYTTNGTSPTKSSTLYTGPFTVSASDGVKAVAQATGYANSADATAIYTIKAPAPVLTPAAGKYTGTQTVTITDAAAGATIYYTTNGTNPTTSSTPYTGPISVSATETIEAIAVAASEANSSLMSATYTITQAPATPVLTPAAGTYTGPQSVTITDATSGATIYYTINNTAPTTASSVYSGPINVSSSETIEAIAVVTGESSSATASAAYAIQAAPPVLSLSAGTYTSPQTVSITDATPGATIYYTTNGTTPTTASALYTGPITVSATETIEAIAAATGLNQSAATIATYTINAPQTATPLFSLASGNYPGTQTVSISDATAGATVYYTTNGTAPTTASTPYSGAITVSTTETIEAIAVAPNYTQSASAFATYTIGSSEPQVATPVITPGSGTYTGIQTVTMTDSTAGAKIYYTTNGTSPTKSSIPYTGPFTVSASDGIKAAAIETGYAGSADATAIYTIRVPPTTFSPPAGKYTEAEQVAITDSIPGATIYYTTNGTTPTTSSTVYTGPISIAANQTITTLATAPGTVNSLVASAAYSLVQPNTTICQAGTTSYCTDETPSTSEVNGYYALPSWTNLQMPLVSITVSDNQVWGLDSSGTLWNLPNWKASPLTWIKVAPGVGQISAGHSLLCQLNSNSHVYCSVAPNPQSVPVNANGYQPITWFDAGQTIYKQIVVSAGNQLWAVDVNNNLIQIGDYTNLAATAVPVESGIAQVAVDGKGLLCTISTQQSLSCSNWPVPNTTANVSSYYHSMSSVTSLSIQLQTIAIADGKLYGTDSSGNLWLVPNYANSATWEKIGTVGVGTPIAAASLPSTFTPSAFAPGDVAVMLFMGQSNSAGINPLPTQFIAPASPNVFGVTNQGWNGMPGNTNSSATFTSPISSINSIQWRNWSVAASGPDMNLGFNDHAAGNAANFASYQWQGMINAGMKLPNLYIIQVSWSSQGVDAADVYTGTPAAWTVNGVNLWQPLLNNTYEPSYALAPFSRRIVYLALSNLLASGLSPRILDLQWNQWEAEAGNANSVVITDAPTNYSNLFNAFYSSIGSHFPVQLVKPLSTAYGATPLSEMQTVFANMVANDPTDFSIIDVSQVSSTIFTGGVLGGGDGSVHYNLDTHEWFARQAIGACLTLSNCGPRITTLPSTPTN